MLGPLLVCAHDRHHRAVGLPVNGLDHPGLRDITRAAQPPTYFLSICHFCELAIEVCEEKCRLQDSRTIKRGRRISLRYGRSVQAIRRTSGSAAISPIFPSIGENPWERKDQITRV